MKYFKANPKFHHWITDDKRFGLTFQRSDDAKSFHKGIKIAVADLIDGRYCHQIVFSGTLIFTFILYSKFEFLKKCMCLFNWLLVNQDHNVL